MPPPEPRSSTISPGWSCASAVGFPQPSDASTASRGSSPVCAALYRFDVIGSQQEHPPESTARAACPYFSFTASLSSMVRSSFAQIYDRARLDGFVPRAALRIQKAQQFLQDLGMR